MALVRFKVVVDFRHRSPTDAELSRLFADLVTKVKTLVDFELRNRGYTINEIIEPEKTTYPDSGKVTRLADGVTYQFYPKIVADITTDIRPVDHDAITDLIDTEIRGALSPDGNVTVDRVSKDRR